MSPHHGCFLWGSLSGERRKEGLASGPDAEHSGLLVFTVLLRIRLCQVCCQAPVVLKTTLLMELCHVRFVGLVRHGGFRENMAQNVTNEMADGNMSCVAQKVILCK